MSPLRLGEQDLLHVSLQRLTCVWSCEHRSDTFFLATGFFGNTDGANGETGCDCNHRGGVPGFVQVTSFAHDLLHNAHDMLEGIGRSIVPETSDALSQ